MALGGLARQAQGPEVLRLIFWSELSDYLRGMAVGVDAVPMPAGLAGYFGGRASHPVLRAALTRALIEQQVDATSTPFMYWLAIHHVASVDDVVLGPSAPVPERPPPGLAVEESVRALLTLLPRDALADWLGYGQRLQGMETGAPPPLLLPPACYRACTRTPAAVAAIADAVGVGPAWRARQAAGDTPY